MTGEEDALSREYVLEGLAVPEQIDAVHDLLSQVVTDHPELDPTDVMLFQTAIIEIANNVVEYGRPAGAVRWEFKVRAHRNRIEAQLNDSGQEFEIPRGRVMPGEGAEGGRGLLIAEALLDEIDFSRKDDTNQWRMVRYLGQERSD